MISDGRNFDAKPSTKVPASVSASPIPRRCRAGDGDIIAYYRVSTAKQGRSGLGIEAQQAAVERYLNGGNWKVVETFTEDKVRPQQRASRAGEGSGGCSRSPSADCRREGRPPHPLGRISLDAARRRRGRSLCGSASDRGHRRPLHAEADGPGTPPSDPLQQL